MSHLDAIGMAEEVRGRRVTARDLVAATLERIRARDGELNCFTAVVAEGALREAEAVDADIGAGKVVGPLAGVPFAVKNLFDVAGLTTLAGSRINAERPRAARDATVVARLRGAGAVLVGALNMDEYAFGFTTENTHYGPTHNPHDPGRVAGGSSGGSGAAVGAGLVPFALGSDTNGSIRVPAALCGIFGLKPTYGRLSRAGTALFGISFDHVGPLATSARDLAVIEFQPRISNGVDAGNRPYERHNHDHEGGERVRTQNIPRAYRCAVPDSYGKNSTNNECTNAGRRVYPFHYPAFSRQADEAGSHRRNREKQ